MAVPEPVASVAPVSGLTSAQAAERLALDGPNALAEAPGRPAWRRFVDQFRGVLVLILAAAAVVAALLGDLKDPIVIAAVLVLNGILGYVQEGRAEHALSALKSMLSLQVKVRRDGHTVEIPAEDLVVGDVVLLEAGDRVPADGRIVHASAVSADESMLTGESLPVDKDAAEPLYMNTVLVRGRAELEVTATGMATEVGRIAGMLATDVRRATPLELQLHTVGTRLAMVAGVAVTIVFALAMARGEAFADALLESVALAVAAVPEGLPAVVTVTLAVGVHQMAKRNAIVKRLASVETLGATTVICSDKTGTLTRNRMTVVAVRHGDRTVPVSAVGDDPTAGRLDLDDDPPPSLIAALEASVLCNDSVVRDGAGIGDPTETALVAAAAKAGIDAGELRARMPRRGELPFDSARKVMVTVHDDVDGGLLLVAKGAPDVLFASCTTLGGPDGERALDGPERHALGARVGELAGQGLRVLGVATRRLAPGHPLAVGDPEAVAAELRELRLDLLAAMIDPPRDEVRDAIATCHAAGISVKMITGDHRATAAAIAAQLGIRGDAVTGDELDAMDDAELAGRIDDIGVFARVSPVHKVRLVEALQARDNVVAMTGDGVNDAAALRTADIGVAMGITGTEVTKEAGDVVLTDDNFATIVAAVEQGRTIYQNIVTFVRFQLSTNIGAIVTMVGAGLFGMAVPFTPVQVLFVNLIADGPPAMALGLDPPEPGIMRRRPRGLGAPVLTLARVLRLVFVGVVMAIGTLSVLSWGEDAHGRDVAKTMAFTTFVLFQLVNAVNARVEFGTVFSRHSFRNRQLWGALAVVALIQVAVVQVGPLQGLFDTVALDATQWIVCVSVALTVLVAEELRKGLARRRGAH